MTKLGEQLENERAKMIKEAKKQPRVVEFMEGYRSFAEYLAEAQVYLNSLRRREYYFPSDRTEQSDKRERGTSVTD